MRSQDERSREVVRLKREMNATSSQDEFAKWAKLRRRHDKALAQYEETSTSSLYSLQVLYFPISLLINGCQRSLASSLKSFRNTFSQVVTVLRFLGTNGLRFLLQFWFAKQPMFWLPRGWVPGFVEWALAFPRAPRGSVSVQVWGIACATVVQLVGEAVVAGWVLVRERREGEGKGREGAKMGVKAGGGGGEGKKEL